MALIDRHSTAARLAGFASAIAGLAVGLAGARGVVEDGARGPYVGVLGIAIGLGAIALGGYLWWSARWLVRHPQQRAAADRVAADRVAGRTEGRTEEPRRPG